MDSIKKYLGIGVLALVGFFFFFGGDSGEQSADLGQVLDRTEFAIERYSEYAEQSKFETIGEEQMGEFNGFLSQVMNSEPRFHDETLGVEMTEVASFEGYPDTNGNGTRDTGEDQLFTVEIDGENRRLIATDTTGAGAHSSFSGSGLIAGLLIGSLLNRQRAGGVAPSSFNNRNTVARSSYSAPSSARSRSRSGGLGKGK